MNTIQFDQVLPHPLKDAQLTGVVWNTQLRLQKGERYLVHADSGKGKSTMLNIIYGTRKDYDGTVRYEDHTLPSNDSSLAEWRKNHLAYLFQDLRLFGNLTALENIMLKPGCTFTQGEIESHARLLGVEQLLNRPCNKLSLGQQQRIAIIRAISQHFEWLLLDEPFSHLDAGNAAKALDLMHQRAQIFNAGIIATSLGDNSHFTGYNHLQL